MSTETERTILVAHNDRATVELITAVLVRDGYHVTGTMDGGDAVARVHESPPAFIITQNGLALVHARQLCMEAKYNREDTKIILLIDEDLPQEERQALVDTIKCDSVLTEPFRYAPVKKLLNSWQGIETADPAQADENAIRFSPPAAIELPEGFALAVDTTAPDPAGEESVPDGEAAPVPIPVPGMEAAAATDGAPQPTEPKAQETAPGESAQEPEPESEPQPDTEPGGAISFKPFGSPEGFGSVPQGVASQESPSPLGGESPLFGEFAPSDRPPEQHQPTESSPQEEVSLSDLAAPDEASQAEVPLSELAPAETPQGESAPVESAPDQTDAPPQEEVSLSELAADDQPEPPPQEEVSLSELAAPEASEPAPQEEISLSEIAAPQQSNAEQQGEVSLSEIAAPEEEIDDIEPEALVDSQDVELRIPMEGDLAQVAVPRLVFELYMATFTGTARLTHGKVTRLLYFNGGFPFRVDSRQLSENLGQLLLQRGEISDEQYGKAQQIMQSKGCNQGQALLSIGAITEVKLLEALRAQTELKLANTFGWREGKYQLKVARPADGIRNEVNPMKIIWRGVTENYDLTSLATFFGAMRTRYIVATPSFDVHAPSFAAEWSDLDLAMVLNGKTTFEQALRSEPRKTSKLAHAMYVLLVTDMVRATDQQGEAAQVPAEETSAPAAGPMAYQELAQVCDDVSREYLRISNANYFEALGVSRAAHDSTIEQSYEERVSKFRAEALPQGLPDDIKKRARDIVEILSKARNMLTDPELRHRYEASLNPQKTSGLEVDFGSVSEAGNVSIDAEKLYIQGQRRLNEGNPDEAIKLFRKAIVQEPNEATYHVALGQALLVGPRSTDDNVRREAVSAFMAALHIDPSHVGGNVEMAKALIGGGHARTAKPYLERVLSRAPDHEEAGVLLAEVENL